MQLQCLICLSPFVSHVFLAFVFHQLSLSLVSHLSPSWVQLVPWFQEPSASHWPPSHPICLPLPENRWRPWALWITDVIHRDLMGGVLRSCPWPAIFSSCPALGGAHAQPRTQSWIKSLLFFLCLMAAPWRWSCGCCGLQRSRYRLRIAAIGCPGVRWACEVRATVTCGQKPEISLEQCHYASMITNALFIVDFQSLVGMIDRSHNGCCADMIWYVCFSSCPMCSCMLFGGYNLVVQTIKASLALGAWLMALLVTVVFVMVVICCCWFLMATIMNHDCILPRYSPRMTCNNQSSLLPSSTDGFCRCCQLSLLLWCSPTAEAHTYDLWTVLNKMNQY